jgi:hypothetical protein
MTELYRPSWEAVQLQVFSQPELDRMPMVSSVMGHSSFLQEKYNLRMIRCIWEEEKSIESNGQCYQKINLRATLIKQAHNLICAHTTKSQRHPEIPCSPCKFSWMEDWRKPEKSVPASPEAVNKPLRFASSIECEL